MSALSVLLLASWTIGAATSENSSNAEDELSLLQLPISRKPMELAPLDAASQAARLQAAQPLAWLHFPKCGSSFANFIIDLPGVCPDVPLERLISNRMGGVDQLPNFKNEYHPDKPWGACHGNIYRWGHHDGVGNASMWEEHYKGKALIMLRQPEQRLMSAYHYGQHSWPIQGRPAGSALEFAQKVQGCTVRQLTRGGHGEDNVCGGRCGGPVSKDEVKLAVKRVHDAAFVGLTDQWALSMCLAHRMFGGPCRQTDFVDSRPSAHANHSFHRVQVRTQPIPWSLKPLRGFEDEADGAVYLEGVKIFQLEMIKYNATLESCQPCFDEAGIEVK